jgi:hypothetical protein
VAECWHSGFYRIGNDSGGPVSGTARRKGESDHLPAARVSCPYQTRQDHVTEEILPFIIYRLSNGELECALWQLQEGQKALAVFLTADNAAAYHQANRLGTEWKIFRPQRMALLEVLRACSQADIGLAVLDPDLKQAKRVFDIKEILAAVAISD